MFEDSDLLQHDVLVLRATAPPDDQFTVLDERGREIGRVIAEEGLGRKQSARLVLYDYQHTPLLIVEHLKRHDETHASYLDGQGQPIDSRLVRLKLPGVFRKRNPFEYTFRDARKAEVGSYAFALPPEGDHRLGVTFLFKITEAVSPELRLATLGFVINMADGMSRTPAWTLKGSPGIGQAWPGSAPKAQKR